MTSLLFCDRLLGFDFHIQKQPNRHVLLLMENCSAYGSNKSLSELQRVKIKSLPPNITSRLQHLDAGITAAMKVCYRHYHMEYAVDVADIGAKELYKVNILSAMRRLLKVW